MPIYEYECISCGRVHETLVRSREEPSACPACGGELKRLISASHVAVVAGRGGGTTCCGREERCDTPPCSEGGGCRRG